MFYIIDRIWDPDLLFYKFIKHLQNPKSQLDFFFFPSFLAGFLAIIMAAKDIKTILRHTGKEYFDHLTVSVWVW